MYRAFPELDRFSDAQCRSFVTMASRGLSRGWKLIARVIVVVLTVPALLVCVIAALALCSEIMQALGQHKASLLWVVPFTIPAVAAPLLANVLLRDKLLRREIATRILAAGCLKCRYSLLGLEWREGLVSCPECGQINNLHERGLRPEDLLAKTGGNLATPSSPPPPA